MTDDPGLSERVRRAFANTADLTERRMFGSLGFLVDGTLRIGVGVHADHVMMVRTGAAQEQALARPGAKPAVMRGRPMSGWVFLEPEAVASDEDVAYWVSVALAAVP